MLLVQAEIRAPIPPRSRRLDTLLPIVIILMSLCISCRCYDWRRSVYNRSDVTIREFENMDTSTRLDAFKNYKKLRSLRRQDNKIHEITPSMANPDIPGAEQSISLFNDLDFIECFEIILYGDWIWYKADDFPKHCCALDLFHKISFCKTKPISIIDLGTTTTTTTTTKKPGSTMKTTTHKPRSSTTHKPGPSTAHKSGSSTAHKSGSSTTPKPGSHTTHKPGSRTTHKPGSSTTKKAIAKLIRTTTTRKPSSSRKPSSRKPTTTKKSSKPTGKGRLAISALGDETTTTRKPTPSPASTSTTITAAPKKASTKGLSSRSILLPTLTTVAAHDKKTTTSRSTVNPKLTTVAGAHDKKTTTSGGSTAKPTSTTSTTTKASSSSKKTTTTRGPTISHIKLTLPTASPNKTEIPTSSLMDWVN